MMHVLQSAIIFALSLSARITSAKNDASVRVPAYPNTTLSGLHQIRHELGPQLSPKAEIYLPGNGSYKTATTRWNGAMQPDFAAVVVPANTEDVATTVRYANKHSVPFLAVNRGHGSSVDMNRLRRGISIYLHNLDGITIASDKQSAVLGGGVYAAQLIKRLAKSRKVAATTAVTCVGVAGAGLGGGMSMYQGLYGLMADNFLEMTIVTADGSTVTANDRQNADLFWAMRGAGHNFGIVTSYVYKIYDAIPTWYAASYQYTEDKLEAVFTELNKLNNNGKQPKELTTYTVFANNPSVSDKPIIILSLWYSGPTPSALRYTRPFLSLSPLNITSLTIPYASLAPAIGLDPSSPICQRGAHSSSFPIGINKFNTTANRQVYELYADMVGTYPELKKSVVQFEAYPMQGVRKVAEGDTVYAHRGDGLLVALQTSHPHTSPRSSLLNDIAPLYGHRFRALIHAGDERGRNLTAYVNYAYGDEKMEEVYGHEEWRIQRLRALKREWDPYGRMGWFHGIR